MVKIEIKSFQLRFLYVCVCVFCLYIRFLELNRRQKPFLALLGDRSSYYYFLKRRSGKPDLRWLNIVLAVCDYMSFAKS